jgi:hypothetical protein
VVAVLLFVLFRQFVFAEPQSPAYR